MFVVLIIVSDNGGEATIAGNSYPWRGSKGSYSRGGISGTGIIHSSMIPDTMRGQTYEGQMHITGEYSERLSPHLIHCVLYIYLDWLPTFMGLATGGLWNGSLTNATLDGVDMWDSIMTNGDSPREEIVHFANGYGSISMNYKMYKLDKEVEPPGFANSVYAFKKDLDSSATDYQCEYPSLMDSYEEEIEIYNANKPLSIFSTDSSLTSSIKKALKQLLPVNGLSTTDLNNYAYKGFQLLGMMALLGCVFIFVRIVKSNRMNNQASYEIPMNDKSLIIRGSPGIKSSYGIADDEEGSGFEGSGSESERSFLLHQNRNGQVRADSIGAIL